MRSTQSTVESTRGANRRHRVRATAASIVALGVILVATIFTTSPATAAGSFLPAGTATATFTCSPADDQTASIVNGIGLGTFDIPAEIKSQAIDSPAQNAPFDMSFIWTFTQAASLVSTSVGLGVTDLQLSNGVNPMIAQSGATGSVVGNPPTQVVPLGDGTQAVTYTQGPFTGSLTRTGTIGDPIVLSPGNISVSVDALTNGTPLLPFSLNFTCAAGNVTPMTLVDQQGEKPAPDYGACNALSSKTTAQPGETVTISGTGAEPNGIVTASVDGKQIGSGTATAAGSYSFSATIPSDSSGSITVSVSCGDGAGVEGLTITVAATSNDGLARTGSSTTVPTTEIGLGLIAFGAGLVGIVRRRRMRAPVA